MEEEPKEYMNLYLGCRVYGEDYGARLVVVGLLGNDQQKYRILKSAMSITDDFDFDKHKLILRQTIDMTDTEKKEYNSLFNSSIPLTIVDAIRTKYLLSKHFDLFGLIESGLAIDAKTLKK